MKKLTPQEKHAQCLREIKGTLAVAAACCLWHVLTAFLLNGTGLRFLGMPAWFSVSVIGCLIIAHVGLYVLLKKVFVNFDYDDEQDRDAEEDNR